MWEEEKTIGRKRKEQENRWEEEEKMDRLGYSVDTAMLRRVLEQLERLWGETNRGILEIDQRLQGLSTVWEGDAKEQYYITGQSFVERIRRCQEKTGTGINRLEAAIQCYENCECMVGELVERRGS